VAWFPVSALPNVAYPAVKEALAALRQKLSN
jgi:hypothetical protein